MSGGAKAKTRSGPVNDSPTIDKKKITINKGGILTEVDAIHAGWVEPRDYVPFTWPPAESGLQDGWLAGTELLISDLHWLLRRPYHRFWSQVVYDEPLAACLDTTLQNLPRPHELQLLPSSPAVQHAVQQVALLVLKAALRMSTYRESKENQLSPGLFAELVYNNYLWDIPRLMDLCAVYAASNGQLLSRQLGSLFTHQPAYVQDLQVAVLSLPELLERVEGRVAGTELEKASLSWAQFWDVLQYVVDLATSLDAFLRVYPNGGAPFLETHFPARLASFYDTVIPRLWRRLEAGAQDEFPAADVVRRHLQLARAALVSVFRRVLDACCLAELREAEEEQQQEAAGGRDRERLLTFGERYVEVMTECLAEQHFIADYQLQHPVAEDVRTVRRACPEFDATRLDYVVDAVLGALPRPTPGPAAVTAGPAPPEEAAPPPEEPGAAAGPAVTGVELESMVSHVQDLLPDLSHSFVVACLEHYNFSSELVINALLEESLPPALAALDRTVEAPPPAVAQPPPPPAAPAPSSETPTAAAAPPARALHSVVTSRRNIHDGDEYDVMTRDDVDLTRFHKGKRLTAARLERELADKSSLHEAGMRERYALFGSLTAEGSVYDAAQYNDEYDDTYDDVATGQEEPREEAEEDSGPAPLNQALPSSRWRRRDPSDDEQEPAPGGARRDQFVENPAEVRARQEARRQEQQRRRGGRAGPPPSRDVVGGPRGQGQDKQVLQNRRRKNEHKSTQHRRGADRKQRGGMY